MANLAWEKPVSIGVASLDAEHEQLFDLLKALRQEILAERRPDVLAASVDSLVTLAMQHSRSEERLFTKVGLPDAPSHILQHEDLTKQIIVIQAKYRAGVHGMLTLELMNYMYNWLIYHTETSDSVCGVYLNAHGIH
jgi:hemerythrin-like metal-binding protein